TCCDRFDIASTGVAQRGRRWRDACTPLSPMNPQNRPTFLYRSSFAVMLGLALAGAAQHEHGHAAGADGFQAMIADVNARMHAGMDVPFTGDADKDFARMIIAHHQGAIDMADAERRNG